MVVLLLRKFVLFLAEKQCACVFCKGRMGGISPFFSPHICKFFISDEGNDFIEIHAIKIINMVNKDEACLCRLLMQTVFDYNTLCK